MSDDKWNETLVEKEVKTTQELEDCIIIVENVPALIPVDCQPRISRIQIFFLSFFLDMRCCFTYTCIVITEGIHKHSPQPSPSQYITSRIHKLR